MRKTNSFPFSFACICCGGARAGARAGAGAGAGAGGAFTLNAYDVMCYIIYIYIYYLYRATSYCFFSSNTRREPWHIYYTLL